VPELPECRVSAALQLALSHGSTMRPPADEEPAGHAPAQRLPDRTRAALPTDRVVPEVCGISTRRQPARRRPSLTPDSATSQVSIGADTTEPANASASAEAGKRASHPYLTMRQQSQH
jgi:hypothetical protein